PCNGPPLIGLGVTHPLVLRRHAAIPPAQIPLSGPSDYRLLIRWFIDAGCRVMLFTNGAQEDDRFLQYIINEGGCRANLRDGSLTVMPRPTVPQELVTLLA